MDPYWLVFHGSAPIGFHGSGSRSRSRSLKCFCNLSFLGQFFWNFFYLFILMCIWLRNCEFYQGSFVSNSFWIRAARIRIRNDSFRIRKDSFRIWLRIRGKVLDPTGSGSDRIRIRLRIGIHNTAYISLKPPGNPYRYCINLTENCCKQNRIWVSCTPRLTAHNHASKNPSLGFRQFTSFYSSLILTSVENAGTIKRG
jgi:hypothetical protein